MTADARLTPEELERTLWGLMQATSPIDGLMVHKVRAHIAALEQELKAGNREFVNYRIQNSQEINAMKRELAALREFVNDRIQNSQEINAMKRELVALRARAAGPTRCECGVPLRRSHFCPELNHAWVSASLAPEDR